MITSIFIGLIGFSNLANAAKILAIDDSATVLEITTKYLAEIGYADVVLAENGKIALQELKEGNIDIIIIDWNMPAMNSLTFVKRIRSGSYASIPILMMTSTIEKEDLVEALQNGVNNYITKPFTTESLKIKMDLLLKSIQK